MQESYKGFLQKKFFLLFLFLILMSSIVLGVDWTYSPGEVNVFVFENFSRWNLSVLNLVPFDARHKLQIPDLVSCDTIDTDATGLFTCGTDSGTGDANIVDLFKIGNYSLEYGFSGWKIGNYSDEYALSGWKLSNYTALNLTCEEITGSADLCDGEDATGTSGTSVWNSTGNNVFCNATDCKIGIGTDTPPHTLTVIGDANITSNLHVGDGNSNIIQIFGSKGAAGTPSHSFINNPNSGMYTTGSDLRFSSNNNFVLVMDQTRIDIQLSGSQGSPALTLGNDLNTGLYRNPDELLFSAGGVEFMRMDEDSFDQLTINDDGVDINFIVETNNNDNMLFIDGGNDKIGIGTNVPTETLVLMGNLSINNTDGTSRLFVNVDTGNVGIGTNTPTSTLHIESNVNQIILTDTVTSGVSNQNAIFSFDDGGNNFLNISTGFSNDLNRIMFSPGGTEAMTLFGSGNIGLGITLATSKLHIMGNINISKGNITDINQIGSEDTPVTNIFATTANISNLGGLSTINVRADIILNDSVLQISKAVDGRFTGLLIENSQADATDSLDETAEINFGFAGKNNVARITADKLSDYTTTAKEDSRIGFWVDSDGTLTQVAHFMPDGLMLLLGDSRIRFAGTAGGGGQSIQYKDSAESNRAALLFKDDVVALLNRAANGVVHIRANNGTGGNAGEVTVANFSNDEIIFLASGGNMGIGTINPTDTLTVIGTLNITGNVSLGTNDVLFVDNTSGRVGIGTTSPDRKLHIVGTDGPLATLPAFGAKDFFVIENEGNSNMVIFAGSSSASEIKFGDNTTAKAGSLLYSHLTDNMDFWTNGAFRMTINKNGNVGIGVTDPDQKLEVAGRIKMTTWTADGDTAAYRDTATDSIALIASDRRLKKNIIPFTGALDIVDQLNTYKYNDLDDKDSDKKQLGLMGQEVLEIIPELSFTFSKEGSDETYYSVHYDKLPVLLLKAIQEQQDQIEELKQELEQLKNYCSL